MTGCVGFYVGAMMIGQANVEMNSERSCAGAEEPDILGPVEKVGMRTSFSRQYIAREPLHPDISCTLRLSPEGYL